MKSFFSLIGAFFALLGFSLFQLVPTVNAIAGNGQQCELDKNLNTYIDSIRLVPREFPAWDYVCEDNLECVPKNPSTNFGTGPQQGEYWCQPRTAPRGNTEIHCNCQNNESTAPGQNGYTCTRADNGQPFSQNNVSVDYCKFGDVCIEGNLDTGRTVVLNGESKFTNVTIKGISCRPEQRVAQCTCVGDRVSCVDGSAPAQEIACKENFFCGSAPGANLDPADLTDRNFMPGVLKKNVTCAPRKATCNCTGTPNEVGKGEMECTFGGRTEKTKCDSLLACAEEEDLTKTISRSDIEDNIFPNVDLAGALCKQHGVDEVGKPPPPPLPPVPPPPCAPGKLTNGICTAFLTGFGEINTDSGSFILRIFGLLLAMSGGIALLLIMRAGYIIMTSAGNGEQVKKGREQLVAAIVGLLLIIFSFVIVQVISVDILRVPEFVGGNTQ